MTVVELAWVAVIGPPRLYPMVEDALTALKVMEITGIERHERFFAVWGWVPQAWVAELRAMLDRASGGFLLVEEDPSTTAHVDAPVLLRNPLLVRPFEALTALFSLPGRAGFDPTIATFLLLPLFFGFVVGDVGHGLALLLVGSWVRRRFRTPVGELVSSFLVLGSLWAMLFGVVLFSEFFGIHVEVGPLRYHLIDRIRDVDLLLGASIGVGVSHLALGLAIGAVYERRRGGVKAALLGRVSWLVVEAGVVMAGLGALGYVAGVLWIPGLALTAAGLLLAVLGGGMTTVLTLPSFVGNILSYLRLGALGVAEALFSGAINSAIGEGLLREGFMGWVVGVPLLVTGHAAIVGAATVVVALHALRLHYVEFYGTFYRPEDIGTPKAFTPTGKMPAG